MIRHAPFSVAVLIAALLFSAAEASARQGDRAKVAAEIESLREQIKAKEAQLLAPPAEDFERYAGFLAAPRTGLVRLLPRESWDGKLTLRGGGAFYSFARRSHDYNDGPDIELAQNLFMVGFAGADFGFITLLGDVPLETVSAETAAVQFMAAYKAPSTEPEARKGARQFQPAHTEGSWQYTRAQTVAEGKTYAVRSIVYGESDVLVAFRVVGRDLDGSVVLLWKMLKKFPTPSLEGGAPSAGS